MPLRIQEHVPLASLTTLGLGGPARYLLTADTAAGVGEALAFARERQLRLFVLGGGSNVVASDRGFNGVVLRPAITGITTEETPHGILVTAGAGEPWDAVVRFAAERGLAGIECLSGIPGSAGATPIQNVGAYGQEVQQTIQEVDTVDRTSGQSVLFSAGECGFGYRQSRFKTVDAGRYVVTSVRFLLRPDAMPTLAYPELRQALERRQGAETPRAGASALLAVRETVLALRRGKSMIVNPADPHSRSAGSFFMNPVLGEEAAEVFRTLLRERGLTAPVYPAEGGKKVSAAWLVEHAGFPRGTRRGNVGVSGHHALALVNYGGTSTELLSLATGIREAVSSTFGIDLHMEPVILE